MILTETEREQFKAAAQPLIEWLRINCHPHTVVIVDSEHAELLEGICAARKRP